MNKEDERKDQDNKKKGNEINKEALEELSDNEGGEVGVG